MASESIRRKHFVAKPTAPLPLILAADDDPNDILLIRLALAKADIKNPLVTVEDGQEAVDYLGGAGPFADRAAYPLPRLLLLDLKMPGMGGFDVLAWLQERPEFNDLATIVLSNSSIAEDIRRAKELGAADYYVKPVRLGDLASLLHQLHERWLSPCTHTKGQVVSAGLQLVASSLQNT